MSHDHHHHHQQQQHHSQAHRSSPLPAGISGGASTAGKHLPDDYEAPGPRPRVPGQETRPPHPMTERASSASAGGQLMAAGDADASNVATGGSAQPPTTGGGQSVRSSKMPSSAHHSEWHQSLVNLLDDSAGAKAFKHYVEQQGGVHCDRLNFYFACEGLKQQTDDAKIKQMVGAIYKFLRKSKIALGNELRGRIKAGLANGAPDMDANIFNEMQRDVLHTIGDTTYPHFLQSEQYIQYLNDNAAGPTGKSAAAASGQYTKMSTGGRPLQTLPEDRELAADASVAAGQAVMPLTLNSLLVSEGQRLDVRPNGPHGYVGQFSSAYNPVSLQNSECMSISSGGRNKDASGIEHGGHSASRQQQNHRSAREGRTDSSRRAEHHQSGGGGASGPPSASTMRLLGCESKHINQHTNLTVQNKQMPMHSSMRANHHSHHSGASGAHIQVLTPDAFNNLLLPKLVAMKHQQDHGLPMAHKAGHGSLFVNNDQFAKALMTADDDNDQSILDQHVLRVFDKSPVRSPGTKSPYPSTASTGAGGGAAADVLDATAVRARSLEQFGGGGSMRQPSAARPSMVADGRRSAAIGSSATLSKHSAGWMGKAPVGEHSGQQAPMLKPRIDSSSRSRSNVPDVACSNTLEEARRRLEDETRISRHFPHYPHAEPLLPPPPAHVNVAASTQESTHAFYEFHDSSFPYRYILAGLQPTLKQYKENLPKKGNFRFFFKTACDDPDSPVIKVEVVNDSDVLPLFEGKVMGEMKPYE